jgi:hypothetical protein
MTGFASSLYIVLTGLPVVLTQQNTGAGLCVQPFTVVGSGVKILLINVLSFGNEKDAVTDLSIDGWW